MIHWILKNKTKSAGILLAIVLLVGIRTFEKNLFYDPFLSFFKLDYQNKSLPVYNSWNLFFGIAFRYFLNTILSLWIIHLLFAKKSMIHLSLFLYIFLFIILSLVFFGILHFQNQPDYLLLFYIRRFLIQPLFLVLFIPAFYYQKNKIKK